MAHARLSPSGLRAAELCPGKPNAEAGYPDTSNKYAQEGTDTHTLLDWCITKSKHPTDYLGQNFSREDNSKFKVTTKMVESVTVAYFYVTGRVADLESQGYTVEVNSEYGVNPVFLGRGDMGGTADIIISASVTRDGPHIVEVIDFKNGVTLVSAENNRQMQGYTIGFMGKLSKLDNPAGYTVVNTIIQPNLIRPGPPSSVTYGIGELRQYTGELLEIAHKTDAVDAPRIPGEEQCHYCKYKHVCRELAGTVLGALGVEVEVLKNLNAEVLSVIIDQKPEKLSPDELSSVLKIRPLASGWFDAVSAHARSEILAGNKIPGYKMVKGNNSKAYAKDEDETVEILKKMRTLDKKKVTDKQIYVSKLKSPSAMIKTMKGKLSDKNAGKLSDLILSSNNAPSLVPESDSREAIATAIEDMFPVELGPYASMGEALDALEPEKTIPPIDFL